MYSRLYRTADQTAVAREEWPLPYDNSQRSAGARRTRLVIINAARELFIDQGFAATTIREVAKAAGVSQETIYKSFGSKAGLLKVVYDVTLTGDDDALPLAERPEAIAAWEAPNPTAAAASYAELARLVSRRTDPLLRVLLRSRGSDEALRRFADTTDNERLVGSQLFVGRWHAAGWLRPDLTPPRAAEILWALNSPEPRWLLQDQGWTEEEFAAWFARTVNYALFA